MIKKDLYLDYEDVQPFIDNCDSISTELNLFGTCNGICIDTPNDAQTYSFMLTNPETSTGLCINFNLKTIGSRVVLDWNIDSLTCSPEASQLVKTINREFVAFEQTTVGSFVSENNNPLEVIRDNTTETAEAIFVRLQEIIGKMKERGWV